MTKTFSANSKSMIRIKRVYEQPDPADGVRVLADRLWPRGISREKAKLDDWMKEIAPSNDLRHWYSHDPSKWEEFKARYYQELKGQPDGIRSLREKASHGTLTLLYGSKEEKWNNAEALKEYLENE